MGRCQIILFPFFHLQGPSVMSAILIESGLVYNSTLSSGTQFDMEYQVTIPTTSGQESLDISFAPVEKVLLYL